MVAGLVSSMIGQPISGLILDRMGGVNGLTSWQWLFLLEGIPSVLMGFVTFRYLTDRPEEAEWLERANDSCSSIGWNRSGARWVRATSIRCDPR